MFLQLYFMPDFSKLLTFKIWYAAVTQSFFSLSVGFGSLITYSSYNDFRHNTYRDALIISVKKQSVAKLVVCLCALLFAASFQFTDTFTSMLAGFVIFGILGNLVSFFRN